MEENPFTYEVVPPDEVRLTYDRLGLLAVERKDGETWRRARTFDERIPIMRGTYTVDDDGNPVRI